jgi:hypothetical protein
VEFETSLNRMLTERRGELYRAGTELGRTLASGGISPDLGGLVRIASQFLGVPIAVMDSRGTVLERSSGEAVPVGGARATMAMMGSREWRDNRLLFKLPNGEIIWFGPVARDNRALVRLASDRIAQTVEAILQRTVDERPRGAARSTALNSLLIGTVESALRTGPLLGLAPDAGYRVLLFSRTADSGAVQRSLNQIGTVYEAGLIDGNQALVLQPRRDATELRRGTAKPNSKLLSKAMAVPDPDWIVSSAEVSGVSQLPAACRQARFTALLMQRDAIPTRSAQFDRLPDIGVFRILFELWGSPALATFIDDALGDLRKRDKRGILRETLLAYLNSGGSHVETASALGIHRNTLAYRLRQIGQLIGRDPGDPDMRLVMHLALVGATLPVMETRT